MTVDRGHVLFQVPEEVFLTPDASLIVGRGVNIVRLDFVGDTLVSVREYNHHLRYYLASYVGPTRDELCPLIGSNGLVALADCNDALESLARDFAERELPVVLVDWRHRVWAQLSEPSVPRVENGYVELVYARMPNLDPVIILRLHFVDGEPILVELEDNRGARLEVVETAGGKGVMLVHERGNVKTTSCTNCLELLSDALKAEENMALVNIMVNEEKREESRLTHNPIV